jgi:hypothetical protein
MAPTVSEPVVARLPIGCSAAPRSLVGFRALTCRSRAPPPWSARAERAILQQTTGAPQRRVDNQRSGPHGAFHAQCCR